MPRVLACFRVTPVLLLGPRTFVVHLHWPNDLSTVELNTIDAYKMQSESGMRLIGLYDMENRTQCNYNVKWNSLRESLVSPARRATPARVSHVATLVVGTIGGLWQAFES